ncbi:hypothetical protein L3Q82_024422 [Scortum barcoo]|uniref:Uncharacterized protein n=1 Tax=Scortum barcoo TaxID=214431 RepID=A0ACB8WQ07_9TELE|nr:hypothetical protein L3Q82_024422 [Scortum barcoo]
MRRTDCTAKVSVQLVDSLNITPVYYWLGDCTSSSKGDEVESEVKGCAGGWVEFTCKYPCTDRKYQDIDLVLPKGKETLRSSEKDVWEKKSSRVSLYHDTTNKHLRVAISQLGQEDFEKYTCEFYQRSVSSPETEKVDIEVETDCQRQFIQTAYKPAQTTITCDYSGNKSSSVQFFCKENGFICEDILSTESSLKSNGTFSLTETSRGFSVSISNVSSHHAAVYWCGVKPKAGSYRASLRKIQLEVEENTKIGKFATGALCSCTDESRFTLSTCDRRDRVWRRRGERSAACNILQHDRFGSGSVMVWGGISLGGRTALHVLARGSLTAIRYRDEILRPLVRPYAGAVGPGFLLMQDNARPHVAGVCQQFLQDEGIDAMDWPALFPRPESN